MVDKILGLTFFRQEKTSKDSKGRFSIYCNWVLWSMDCWQLPFIHVEEAVSWTQRFLTGNIWPKNRSLVMTNKFESKCLQKFHVSSKKDKECNMKTTYYLEEPSRHNFLSTLHAKNDTTNLSGYKLDKSTENNKFLLFFSGKETIQTFNGSIKAITLLFAKR